MDLSWVDECGGVLGVVRAEGVSMCCVHVYNQQVAAMAFVFKNMSGLL